MSTQIRIKKYILKIPTELYIFLFAVIYRLPSLGYDFINGDAYHWKERGYAFGSAIISLSLKDTAVTYHPGVTLLWSQFVSNKLYSLINSFYYKGSLAPKEEFLINNFLQKFVLVIITSILITLVYHLLKRFIGLKAALAAVLLILLEPFYLALSRAIHLDVLLTLLMFIAFLYFFGSLYIPDTKELSGRKKLYRRYRDVVLAGVFMGLSFVTKSSALYLGLLFVFLTLLHYVQTKNKEYLKNFGLMVMFSLLTFCLVWPAMITTPITTLNSYIFQGVKGVALEEGHGHIWFGKETQDPGFAFYPIVLAGRFSLLLITLAFGGLIYWAKNNNRPKLISPKLNTFLFYNLIYFIGFFVMITLVSKKLDRYLLPAVMPLAVFGTYYLDKIFKRKTLNILLIFFVFARFILFIGIHPNYLAYYSPLVGGVEGGKNVIEPKWMVGYDEVAKYFNLKQDPEKIKVAIADYDYLTPFARFEVLNIKHEPERDKAEYFVLPVYRQSRNKDYENLYELERLNDRIEVAGVDYFYVYKVIRKL